MAAADRVQRLVPHLVEHAHRARAGASRAERADPLAQLPRRLPPCAACPASVPGSRCRRRCRRSCCGSLTNTGTLGARSCASCGGAVYGHATTRSGASAAMRSRSSVAASPTRGSARAAAASRCARPRRRSPRPRRRRTAARSRAARGSRSAARAAAARPSRRRRRGRALRARDARRPQDRQRQQRDPHGRITVASARPRTPVAPPVEKSAASW